MKKIVRSLLLILLIMLASFGVPLSGTLFSERSRFTDKETTIELVIKKDEEEHESEDQTAEKQ
jgi:hypothetical protein